jgi:5-methylcytosine-specific restriction protein A
MPKRPPPFAPAGRPVGHAAQRQSDQRRGSARARGYDARWDKAAARYRANNPLCLYCAIGVWGQPPRDTPATCVDHLIPHRLDPAVFWCEADWVSACAPCHDGPKQAAEASPARLAALANAVRAHRAAADLAGVEGVSKV